MLRSANRFGGVVMTRIADRTDGTGSIRQGGGSNMGEMQRVLVSGRVQQVGYRDYVVREAQKLGVKGWVRNLSDGRVELLADADAAVLDEFLSKCREGPRFARIDDISAFPVEERPVKGFTKRFTP